MKKIISVVLIICTFALIFAGCGAKAKNYELAIGVAVTDKAAKLSADVTVASVVIADGKIALCRIDAISPSAKIENDAIVGTESFQSKAEQGDNYNMVAYGGAKSEWYVQAKFFEEYVTGKTLDEVKNVKTGDEALVAGCTIDVADFVIAITKAFESDDKIAFTSAADLTLGVAITASSAEKKGAVNLVYNTAATVIADGKVAAAVVDAGELSIAVENGAGTTVTYAGSKLEQGDNYNMVAYGGSISEWYVQAKTFAATAVGKTAAELADLPVEGIAGCTIAVDPYKPALVNAGKYAR